MSANIPLQVAFYLNLLLKFFGFSKNPSWKVARGLKTIKKTQPLKIQSWEAITEDSQFTHELNFWWPGWYMLELTVNHDQPSGTATFYFDRGKGLSEDDRIDIPLKQDKLCKRLVYISRATRSIRFDPLSTPGQFTIVACRFVWLTPRFALIRLLRRIAAMHPDYNGTPHDLLLNELKAEALGRQLDWKEWIQSRYQETFNYSRIESSYPHWLKKQADKPVSSEQVNKLKHKPLISILVPVFNTPPNLLQACVDSVRGQSYPNWQLCIADDCSTSTKTRETLAALDKLDVRINVVWRTENGHICAASNSALEIARGEYCALLDHDDELAEDALYHVAAAINASPEAMLFYSDEDKLDQLGNRCDPHFKPQWNPDLILSQNYVCHLGVYSTQRLRSIGGFRIGYEGSQDHDLVLRFTHGLSAAQIIHIPRVLYHWRAIAGSTALASTEKSYTHHSGLAAVQNYLEANYPDANAQLGKVPNSYRVVWPIPQPAPLVTLLVPTRDAVEILQPCIDAILEGTEYRNFELIILDNESRCEQTLRYMDEVQQRDTRVRVESWHQPFNYSAINNFGVSLARGSIIGLINNDIEPINGDWLTEMVGQVSRPDIGCVGAKLYYPNHTIQHAGVILGIGGVAGHSHKYLPRGEYGYFSRLQLVQNLSAVTAACLLVRKSVFEQVGGLNERHLAVAFNDVDFCLKVRAAGYRNLWTPYAELYHHESVSRGDEDSPEKKARFQREIDYMRRTWGRELDQDPAYNPNLTLAFEDFSLR